MQLTTMNLKAKRWLITGATGSFGTAFIRKIMSDLDPVQIRALSRDELKQSELAAEFQWVDWMLGDVRDCQRIMTAARGVDIVIHAAALKRIEKGERDPREFIATNIMGTLNVSDAVIEQEVEKACFISTDKAVEPVNLYGGTKFVAEKAWLASNAYVGNRQTALVAVRYGNVIGSRGSVIQKWTQQAKGGFITITDPEATRFFLPMENAMELVLHALGFGQKGETYIPICLSVRIPDLADAVAPGCRREGTGLSGGEKRHETLVSKHEMARARINQRLPCVILSPQSPSWEYTPPNLNEYVTAPYRSSRGPFMEVEKIREHIYG